MWLRPAHATWSSSPFLRVKDSCVQCVTSNPRWDGHHKLRWRRPTSPWTVDGWVGGDSSYKCFRFDLWMLVLQNLNSASNSTVIGVTWSHWVPRAMNSYIFLVNKFVMFPKTISKEIVEPATEATFLAEQTPLSDMFAKRAKILDMRFSGILSLRSSVISTPSHVACFVGSQWDFSMFITKPACFNDAFTKTAVLLQYSQYYSYINGLLLDLSMINYYLTCSYINYNK